MAATNLLSTQQRIVKSTSPDFYRELEQGEFGAYVDQLAFFRKAKSLNIPFKLNTMKGAQGEQLVKVMETARAAVKASFIQTKTGLKEKVNLEEAVEQGIGMASPHAAGKGYSPDETRVKKVFSFNSEGLKETVELSNQIQVKNYTGTPGAEHKAEASANKAKNMDNAPPVSEQTGGKITLLETDEVIIKFDTHHLVTFMVGKPKLDQGAFKYYTDEKV